MSETDVLDVERLGEDVLNECGKPALRDSRE